MTTTVNSLNPLILVALKAVAAVRQRAGLPLNQKLMRAQAEQLAEAAAALSEGAVHGAIEEALEKDANDLSGAINRLAELSIKRRVHLHPTPPKPAPVTARVVGPVRLWIKARSEGLASTIAALLIVGGSFLYFDLPLLPLEGQEASTPPSPAARGVAQFFQELEPGSSPAPGGGDLALGIFNTGLLWVQGAKGATTATRAHSKMIGDHDAKTIVSWVATDDSVGLSVVKVLPVIEQSISSLDAGSAALEQWLHVVEHVEVIHESSCPVEQKWAGLYQSGKRPTVRLCPQASAIWTFAIISHEAAHHLQFKRRIPQDRIIELEADAISGSVMKALGVPLAARDLAYISVTPDAAAVLKVRRKGIEQMAAVLLAAVANGGGAGTREAAR